MLYHARSSFKKTCARCDFHEQLMHLRCKKQSLAFRRAFFMVGPFYLGGLKLRIGALENCRRDFQGLLFRFVEPQFKSKLDAAVSHDTGCAEGDVVETVLAVHEGRDHEDGTLITEDCLADARDTGCDREAGVAFEACDLGTGVAD